MLGLYNWSTRIYAHFNIKNISQIKPDYNLKIMEPNQTLFSITSKINKLEAVLENFGPDLVMVHGDTTTTLSASLASFIKKLSWHILKQDLGHQ